MHARTESTEPAPPLIPIWNEAILYRHHFWLASASFGLEAEPATNPNAQQLVLDQIAAFGDTQPGAFAVAPEDRRSKHSLYPTIGEPTWRKVAAPDDEEAFCWAYQIDDVTSTVAAVRAKNASEAWFDQAEKLIVAGDADPTLLGSCDCRAIRAASNGNFTKIVQSTFGAGSSSSRSVISLGPNRTITLYQGFKPRSEELALLAILPVEDDADHKASDILNRVIPDFVRLLLKIEVVSRNWETNLRPDTVRIEQKLVATELPRGRRALERELKHLVYVHHSLARNISFLRHQSQSVSTNLVNLESLRAGLSLSETGWFEAGLVTARLAREQLQRDLDYFVARLDEAEVRISACRVGSDLERIRSEESETNARDRRTNLLAIVGLILAAAQILDGPTTHGIIRAISDYPKSMSIGPLTTLVAKLGLLTAVAVFAAMIVPNFLMLLRLLGTTRRGAIRAVVSPEAAPKGVLLPSDPE